MDHFLMLALYLQGIAQALEDKARTLRNFSRLRALSNKLYVTGLIKTL